MKYIPIRVRSLATVAAAATLILAACGSDDSSSDTAGDTAVRKAVVTPESHTMAEAVAIMTGAAAA